MGYIPVQVVPGRVKTARACTDLTLANRSLSLRQQLLRGMMEDEYSATQAELLELVATSDATVREDQEFPAGDTDRPLRTLGSP